MSDTSLNLMIDDEVYQNAIRWWLARYVHSLSARHFIERDLAGDPIQTRIRLRNKQFWVRFTKKQYRVEIVALDPAAAWAAGDIFCKIGGQLVYRSRG